MHGGLAHAEAAGVETALRARGLVVLPSAYAERVTLRIGARPDQEDRLAATLAEATGGHVMTRVIAERWVDSLDP